jgi:TPR repeat protein
MFDNWKTMKKTICLAALILLGPGGVTAADHPELSAADEAYSAENFDKAVALYRKDAELGVIDAQVNLALMYQEGQGVAQDFAQAAKWFGQAAKQGNAEAQHNLGLLYLEGKGVAKNLVEADKWFRLAGSASSVAGVEKQLTPTQTAEAKNLAETWQAEFQKAKAQR